MWEAHICRGANCSREPIGTARYALPTLVRMCGIAGLFSKSAVIEDSLGHHLAAMLLQLGDRGPDSAGVAFYRDRVPAGWCKVSLHSPTPSRTGTACARRSTRPSAPASPRCGRATR